MKLGLVPLLPSFPEHDIDEKARTIEMLFGGENFHFGNPVSRFREELAAGDHLPERRAMRSMVAAARRREHDRWLEDLLLLLLLLQVAGGPPDGAGAEHPGEQGRGAGGRHRGARHHPQVLLHLHRHLLLLLHLHRGLFTIPRIDRVDRGGVRAGVRARYLEEIRRIKREVGEEGLSSDDEEGEGGGSAGEGGLREVGGGLRSVGGSVREVVGSILEEESEEVEGDKEEAEGSREEVEVRREEGGGREDLQPCFLALVRELFLGAPGLRLTLDQVLVPPSPCPHPALTLTLTLPLLQVERGLEAWQAGPIAALNPW